MTCRSIYQTNMNDRCLQKVDVSVSNISVRIEGTVQMFNSTKFLAALAASVNITVSRLSIFSIRNGRFETYTTQYNSCSEKILREL